MGFFLQHACFEFQGNFFQSPFSIYSTVKSLCLINNISIKCLLYVGTVFVEVNTLIWTLKSSEYSRESNGENKHFQYSKIIAVV